MTQPSQCDRVLAAARRGPINTSDFLLPNVVDGRKPITRVPARVLDLEARGHRFAPKRQPNATVTYTLIFDAGDVDRSDGLTVQATVETKAAEPRSDIGPSTIASACATDGADGSGVASPAPSGVAAGSLFDDGDYASRSDYRDAEKAA